MTCTMPITSRTDTKGSKADTAADVMSMQSNDVADASIQGGKGNPDRHTCMHAAPFTDSEKVNRWPWCLAVILVLFVVVNWGYWKFMGSTSESAMRKEYIKYLREYWSRDGDALLANTSLDRSFTRYGDRRIYFRVTTRKIPVLGTTPIVYKMKFGLPEVDDENRWRGEDDDEHIEWRVARENMKCVGDSGPVRFHSVGRLSDGMRFTSSYVMQSVPDRRAVKKHIPCLQAVMPLMCEGDKWEVVCGHEESFGDFGEGDVPPAATTVWRVSMEDVKESRPRSRKEVEALLAAYVWHAEGTSPMSRRRLFELVKEQLVNQTAM